MGGAFLSRLNKVLREERGYTYGVRMDFSPHRSGGSYAVQGSFRTEVVVDAVATTRELLDVDDDRSSARRSPTRSRTSPVLVTVAVRHRRWRRRPGCDPDSRQASR